MKNRSSAILLLITCVFFAFTIGFFVGRATSPSPVILSPLETQVRAVSAPAGNTEPRESTAASTAPVRDTTPATEPVRDTAAATEPVPDRININTATAAQLDTLPGIGPVLAQRIIDYREANGPFVTLGQLIQVNGIGQKKLEQILDLITIE